VDAHAYWNCDSHPWANQDAHADADPIYHADVSSHGNAYATGYAVSLVLYS
jgi:hypothetical protein